MGRWNRFTNGWRALRRRSQTEAELSEELQEYVESLTREKMQHGLSRAQARRAALVEVGSMETVKEKVRTVGWEVHLSGVWKDLRHGVRMFRQRPALTAVAVLTLALGIGANTAIFSVVHSVLLKPLPFKEPSHLVYVYEAYPEQGFFRGWHSASVYRDWKERNQVFSQISAIWHRKEILTGGGEAAYISSALVPAEFFSLFRLKPILGRGFTSEEVEAKAQVAVLSYGLWQERFGRDGEIVGKTVILSGRSFTVIGVLPPGKEFPRGARLWAPLVVPPENDVRGFKFMYSVARLKPGVTLEQARADMTAVAKGLEEQYPQHYKDYGTGVFPLQEEIVGDAAGILWLLLGAVSCVLLIACANIANLLLARSAAREREIAIRAALGAGPGRLVRQLLAESVLLAGLGGTLGFLLAWGSIELLKTLNPQSLPRVEELGMEWQVLAYTVGVAVVTGILFGLVPALRSSRPNLTTTLKEGTRTGGGASGSRRQHRFRDLLVVSEVALAMVLLVGAGLLVRSFLTLLGNETGFDPGRILTMRVTLPEYKYPAPEQREQFFERLLQRTATVGGVKQVGAVNVLPFSGSNWFWSFYMEGTDPSGDPINGGADYRVATPGYFRTLGVPLLRGRTFSSEDRQGAPGAFIVNEAFVKKFFPRGDIVGRRIRLETGDPWSTIVGVVGNVRHRGLGADFKPEMYRPFPQDPRLDMTVTVRAAGRPTTLARTLYGFVHEIDPDQPVSKISTMEGMISESVSQMRFVTLMLGLFAATAGLLAAVGVYGVVAYSVSQRSHEIGLRMAIGAQRSDVLWLVLAQGGVLTGIGIAVGFAGAYGMTRFLSNQLYQITPTDPVTFASIAVLLAVTSMLACYIPARRATRVDPLVALRYE